MEVINNRLHFGDSSSYIEATLGQHIKLAYNAPVTMKFRIVYQIPQTPPDNFVISFGAPDLPVLRYMSALNKWVFTVSTSYKELGAGDTAVHTFEYDGLNAIYDGETVWQKESTADPSQTYTYIFPDAQTNSPIRIYQVKIWEGDALIYDFRPALISDVYGFQEVVNDNFYPSASAAQFTGNIAKVEQFDVDNDNILSIHSVETLSLLGDELSYDTISADVQQKRTLSLEERQGGAVEVVATYDDSLKQMPYGTPMLHYIDEELASRYFIEEMKRTGRYTFGIDGISAIGILSRQYHAGGLYSGANFILVIAEILGSSISYSVSYELGNVRVYGYLPFATRRDNLRQLLFATNGHVFRDANRQIYFDFLDDSETAEILDGNIFENGSVEYPKLATKVTVTEHNYYYFSGAQPVTLFDNTNGYEVNDLLVKFQNAPIYPASLAATGTLTFRNASVNCAYVSGIGTLTGIPYIHTTLDVIREDEDSGREEYEVSVPDATMVTAANSEGVADRVADYWFNRHIVKADIKWTSEKCGKLYQIINAFAQNEECYLVKMEKIVSSFVRARCEFIAGVGSGTGGNTFENYAVITANGSWSIPQDVEVIRLIIIGGGNGGQSGLKGHDGNVNSAGAGGNSGSAGNGGRIFVVTLNNVSGSLSIAIGSGGTGGAACSNEKTPNEGTEGAASTVTYDGTTYTSAAGARSPAGVENIFTGVLYALPGTPGTGGAPGGEGLEYVSEAGGSVGNITGGAPGSAAYGARSQTSGGAGGGASATTQGGAGTDASTYHMQLDQRPNFFDYYLHYPGHGGNGATSPKRPAATTPGQGGNGGHGGGGAGGAGVFNGTGTDTYDGDTHIKTGDFLGSDPYHPGIGGNGGAGGDGAPGCVIIYY